MIMLTPIRTIDPALLLCSLEMYKTHRTEFAETYLVRHGEHSP